MNLMTTLNTKKTAAHTPMPVKESKAIYLWTKVKHNLKYLI